MHIYALLRAFYAVRASVLRETGKEAVSKTAVCLSRRRGNGCLGMQKDFSGNLVSLQFAERFHFLLFQKFVDAAKVFADALVAELVHLAYQSVEEVTVVADNNQCAVEVHQCLLQDVFGLQVQMVGRLVQDEQVDRFEQQFDHRQSGTLAAG